MRPFRTKTKEELIEALSELPDGALVVFASDYGDHCHTQQVHALRGDVEEQTIRETAYSDSGWGILEEDEEWNGLLPKVWVLS